MESRPETTPSGWDATSDAYDKYFATPFTTKFALEALPEVISKPKNDLKILDVAAGTGALALSASKFLSSFQNTNITATDFSPSMIEKLRKKIVQDSYDGITTEVADGQVCILG
jgi:ubiquinone/menaquinone biosynthesis C-methylase UbiE